MPLGLLSNLSHTLSNGSGPPGTNLRVLADITIREALKDHKISPKAAKSQEQRHTIISASDMKTQFPL